MFNNIKIKLQYFIPQLLISKMAGFLASQEAGWLTQIIIKAFARYYRVDMTEARYPEFVSYHTFNEFFVRPLRTDARPINSEPNTLVFPADGIISQLGSVQQNQIMQAKNHRYTLEALLAGNRQLENEFHNGLFITTYLAPQNYHRVHMPCGAVLREMIYVPGDLFSVNPLTTENVPNLFARNERVICVFDTAYGTLAQILVGATIVGSIVTVWAGTICPPREGIVKRWIYPPSGEEGAITLNKGQEMGHFKLGSTVINLFSPGRVVFSKALTSGTTTYVGEILATGVSSSASC